jgi:fermentation-respiration switch protein FrsA (DUF1100 family)
VSIIGCGDYETLARHRAAANGCAPDSAEFARRMPPSLLTTLQARDPVHRTGAMAQVRLRIVGAGRDTLVPPACNARFVERLRAVPGAVCEQVIVPDLPHTLAPAMIAHTADWFRQYTA